MSPPPTSTSSGEPLSVLVSSYSYSTVSYLLALTEVILVIMKMDGLRHGLVVSGLTNSTALVGSEQPSLADMESLVVSLLVTLAVILGVMVVANLYTIGQTINALLFSQRTHLQRSVAKHDVINSEGFLQAVKKEVNLVKEMDIVVVDGLDSVEQRKVLSVLDTVHTLFSDPGSPFIILLAIDPHVITKAIELNLNQVFSDTSIGGDAYLRNMVHLPFFLQNSGLRKVKTAQQVASKMKGKIPCIKTSPFSHLIMCSVPVPLLVRERGADLSQEVLVGVRRPGRVEEEQEEEAGGDGESGQQSGQQPQQDHGVRGAAGGEQDVPD